MKEILLDVTRLLSRTDRDAPTGIDRVCLAYVDWLSGHADFHLIPVRVWKGQLWAVDPTWFASWTAALVRRWEAHDSASEVAAKLFELLSADSTTAGVVRYQGRPNPVMTRRRRWRNFTLRIRSHAKPELRPGQIYLNVGHTGLEQARIMSALTRAGVNPVIMIHDLIPITHPEYSRTGDDARHRGRILTALAHARTIVTDSGYTRDRLEQFAEAAGRPKPNIVVAHLGVSPAFLQKRTERPMKPYFLYVGTIEGRKNLAFLQVIWRRLYEKLGEKTPHLVLAGRYGWEHEAVLDQLERSPASLKFVHHAAELSDTDLVGLMAGARALVAPSFVEGFDLPPLEACGLRTPIIASDIPAHRELLVGARLIDPIDGFGWLEALEAAIHTPPPPLEREAPTWDGHFSIIEAQIYLVSAEAP